jgi:GNAT superfamily N-acetyltransferase
LDDLNEILIRDAQADDEAFFFNALLQHYKHSSPHSKLIPDRCYYVEHKKLIDRQAQKQSNILKIACLKDDPQVVFGFMWANQEELTLHYCYVKKAFRRLGIAKLLFNTLFKKDDEIFYTHLTYDGGFITHSKGNFNFNPYKFYGA